MSLAILPSSPMGFAPASPASATTTTTTTTTTTKTISSLAPSPSKRPKLSLNTVNAAPTFGKKSTSLRLETLSATSPTAVNTFSNGYDAEKSLKTPVDRPRRPALALALALAVTAVPAQSPSRTPVFPEPSDSTDPPDSPDSSAVSHTSASSAGSPSHDPPYKLAYTTDSILKNGPYPRTRAKQRTSFAPPRALFPHHKTVTFRACLTEDIHTVRYTRRNSDFPGPSSPRSTRALSSRAEGEAMKAGAAVPPVRTHERAPTPHATGSSNVAASPQPGDKRESSDEEKDEDEEQDEEDSDVCPQTPVAGRRKRTRQWRWTLGPLDPPPAAEIAVEPGDARDDESMG